jgi:hypothetical protein
VIVDKSRLVKGRYTVKFQWSCNQDRYQVEKEYFCK